MKNARRRPARPGRPQPGKPAPKQQSRQKPAPKKPQPRPAPEEPRTLRLGLVPGTTPGRWIDTWKERMPHVELELVPLTFADPRERLGEVDLALVRMPLEHAEDLHVIPLYDEVPVVVTSAESHLMAAEELSGDDLAGEVLITPADDVLGPVDLPTVAPRFPAIETTADAVATVASGVGIMIVPMSLARLHKRKDVDYRILRDGPTSTVALAWPRDVTTRDIETFVGIVRGRTANSSR